jgi:hypothetical protein
VLGVGLGADLEEVLKRLPKLSSVDLEKVALRVGFMRGGKSVKNNSSEYDWLLEGFLIELRKRGLWVGSNVPKKLITHQYLEKSAEVRKFLLTGLSRTKLSSAEHLELGMLAGTVLMEYLSKAKVALNLKMLTLNVDKVPFALEESFPGYWAARLLGFCLRRS